jgi:hypothetical protein
MTSAHRDRTCGRLTSTACSPYQWVNWAQAWNSKPRMLSPSAALRKFFAGLRTDCHSSRAARTYNPVARISEKS